jgi:hypothetical protein
MIACITGWVGGIFGESDRKARLGRGWGGPDPLPRVAE